LLSEKRGKQRFANVTKGFTSFYLEQGQLASTVSSNLAGTNGRKRAHATRALALFFSFLKLSTHHLSACKGEKLIQRFDDTLTHATTFLPFYILYAILFFEPNVTSSAYSLRKQEN
jgi:hypothetical protein